MFRKILFPIPYATMLRALSLLSNKAQCDMELMNLANTLLPMSTMYDGTLCFSSQSSLIVVIIYHVLIVGYGRNKDLRRVAFYKTKSLGRVWS